MVLFIEKDYEQVASKAVERRKIEKGALYTQTRRRVSYWLHRAAFQLEEIPCNVSSRDYKYRPGKE